MTHLENYKKQTMSRPLRFVSEGRIKRSAATKSKPSLEKAAAPIRTKISFQELINKSPNLEILREASPYSAGIDKNKENESSYGNDRLRETGEEEDEEIVLKVETGELRTTAIRSDSEPFSESALEEALEIYEAFFVIGLTRDKCFKDAMDNMWNRLACREGVKLA